MKKCIKCKKEKTLEEFPKFKRNKDGRHSHCRECRAIERKAWGKKNKDRVKESNRKAKLKANYGIDVEFYDYLFESQGGRCKVCGKIYKSGRRLSVDHNHLDGKVRGLLCSNCNTALGLLKENINIINKLKAYLEEA